MENIPLNDRRALDCSGLVKLGSKRIEQISNRVNNPCPHLMHKALIGHGSLPLEEEVVQGQE